MKNKKNIDKINILIAIDNNYINQAMNLLYSLKKYNNVFFNIFLTYNNLEDSAINEICSFAKKNNIGKVYPYYIDISKYNLPMYIDYISQVTYLRLYAPFIIKEKIDRLLYLDCDIICAGSILNFYNINFENNVLVACENLLSDEIKYLKEKFNLNLGLPEDNIYVNAGVLLINIEKYRESINSSKLNKFIEDNYEILYMQDQDIINKLFYGKIKLADIKYNYQINAINYGEETYNNCLIHYSEAYKPWNYDYIYPQKAIYYYKLLKQKGEIEELRQLINMHTKNEANELFEYIIKN